MQIFNFITHFISRRQKFNPPLLLAALRLSSSFPSSSSFLFRLHSPAELDFFPGHESQQDPRKYGCSNGAGIQKPIQMPEKRQDHNQKDEIPSGQKIRDLAYFIFP